MTPTLGAAVGLVGLAALAPLLPLDRAAPLAAAGAWLSAVAARAILVVLLALVAVFYTSAPLIGAIGHWCVEVPPPFNELELVITGHLLAQAIVATPAVIAAVSLCRALVRTWREARRVSRMLKTQLLWTAPGDAAVIAGSGVFVATAGISKPRLVVSAGALVALDDDEMAASLDHERGHIRRGHRFILLACDVFMGLACFVPGARAARPEIAYHLERDADQWSLRRNHDPVVLARAICKAALTPAAGPALTGLGTGRTVRRVETLLRTDRGLAPRRRTATGMSVGLALTCVLALSAVPATAAAGVHEWRHHQPERHCIE
ncbi:MAG: M56 family metallopeptidase [Solirubrobacteraceae bacterium]